MLSIITSLYRSEHHLTDFCKHARAVSRELTDQGVAHEFVMVANDATESERKTVGLFAGADGIPVRVIHCPRESIYASWNRGVREANGDIVTFWNVDDIRFSKAIVDGLRYISDGADCVYFPFVYKRYVVIAGLSIPVKHKVIEPAGFDPGKFENEMHAGPFFMIRKSAVQQVGWFDETFRIAGDFDFMVRAARRIKFKRSKALAGIFKNDGRTLSGSKSTAHAAENFRITGRDLFTEIFGMHFMDATHEYPDQFGNVRYYHRLKGRICIDFIERNAAKDKTFLDAGAGRGPYSLKASDSYLKVFCFEYDQAELNAARSRISASNVEFGQVDLTAIPLPDNSIDVAVCSEVLEHIPANSKAVSELYRVLKPGGKLLVSMPNRFSLFYQRVYLRNRKNWFPKPAAGSVDPYFEARRHLEYPFWKIERLVTGSPFHVIIRRGANVLPLPDSLRKRLILSHPILFRAYVATERFLSSLLPWFSSFYFVELKK